MLTSDSTWRSEPAIAETTGTLRAAGASFSRRVKVGLALCLTLVVVMAGYVSVSPAQALTGLKATALGANTVKLTWTAVPKAPGYRVQYSANSNMSSSLYVPARGASTFLTTNSAIVTNLAPNKTWYFRVAPVDKVNQKKLSDYSGKVSAKPGYTFAAPTKLSKVNVGATQVELEWLHVSGAPGYRVKATASGKPTVYASSGNSSATLKGLVRNTTYKFSVYVESPAVSNVPALQLGPWSSSYSVKTTNSELLAPTNLKSSKATHDAVDLSWTPPANMKSGYLYSVRYGLNSSLSSGAKTAPPVEASSVRLTGLKENTNYYVRVTVVDARKAVKSDTSDFALLKTRVPLGTLRGSVTGPPGADTIAMAYDAGNEMAQQVDVNKSGEYEFSLRPGKYKVRIGYLGQAGYITGWAKAGADMGVVQGQATSYPVELKETTNAKTVKLTKGEEVTGVVTDSDTKKAVRDVDVTALSDTSEREVMSRARTDSSGRYTLAGLPNGKYIVRMRYSQIGFRSLETKVEVKDSEVKVSKALPMDEWVQRYGVYVKGSFKVGGTVYAKPTGWRASNNPLERSSAQSYQWRRNGAAIKGATKSTYKLTKSDKGSKRISLTVTHSHIGFKRGTATSSAYTVK